jgi:hypothetical protein
MMNTSTCIRLLDFMSKTGSERVYKDHIADDSRGQRIQVKKER